MEFLFIIIGFVLLIKAADYFVDASVNIAKIFNVSEIIIGATIVSIGTTLPETMVSATSAFKGHGDIAYGNAIGSIVCNTALISAISMLFSPSKVNRKDLKAPTIFFFSTFLIYAVCAYFFSGFNRISGIILVSTFVLFIIYTMCTRRGDTEPVGTRRGEGLPSPSANTSKIIKSVLILIISAIVIAFASNLLVDNGTIIARKYGVPESVIGITMIAFGTSLPELSTAITSLLKGYSSLALGNIIGANFFNLAIVTGIAATIAPFSIPSERMLNSKNLSLLVDVPLAFIVMIILCIPSLLFEKTKRWQGIVLIIIYVLFLIYQFKSL